METKLLSESDLAKRFNLTTRTIQNWRKAGIGPAHIVIGKNTIRYRHEDVAAYEETSIKHNPAQGEGND